VVTTNMKPGYIQKNGVPYSASAVLTEHFDVTHEPTADAADRNGNDRGPHVPCAPLPALHALPQTGRRLGLGSAALLAK